MQQTVIHEKYHPQMRRPRHTALYSHFIRRYLAANKLEGTREGRIYPDVWKRLPIKVALAQIEELIEAIYNEPADSGKMQVIHKLRAKYSEGGLGSPSFWGKQP